MACRPAVLRVNLRQPLPRAPFAVRPHNAKGGHWQVGGASFNHPTCFAMSRVLSHHSLTLTITAASRLRKHAAPRQPAACLSVRDAGGCCSLAQDARTRVPRSPVFSEGARSETCSEEAEVAVADPSDHTSTSIESSMQRINASLFRASSGLHKARERKPSHKERWGHDKHVRAGAATAAPAGRQSADRSSPAVRSGREVAAYVLFVPWVFGLRSTVCPSPPAWRVG